MKQLLVIVIMIFAIQGCGTSVDVKQISTLPKNMPVKVHGVLIEKLENEDIVARTLYRDDHGNYVFAPEVIEFLTEIYYMEPHGIQCMDYDLRLPKGSTGIYDCTLEELKNSVVILVKHDAWQYLAEVISSQPESQ